MQATSQRIEKEHEEDEVTEFIVTRRATPRPGSVVIGNLTVRLPIVDNVMERDTQLRCVAARRSGLEAGND